MKNILGMWFPDTETHLEQQVLLHNPIVEGRGTYQYRKYAAALPWVIKKGHAVDIGAQIGLWSRVMAINFDKVTAFEPLPDHQQCFEMNMKHALDKVTLHKCALTDAPGFLKMNMPPKNTGNTHVAVEGEAGVEVPARTLDSFKLTDIDFMKIDVEGYELPVVKGAKNTILSQRPTIVIEQKPGGQAERYGRRQYDAVDLLKAWGGTVRWDLGGDLLVTWG